MGLLAALETQRHILHEDIISQTSPHPFFQSPYLGEIIIPILSVYKGKSRKLEPFLELQACDRPKSHL